MKPEDSFDRLARRDAELNRLTAKGQRRSLLILVLTLVPVPIILVMLLNHDTSAAGVIPIGIVCIVAISTSWRKWQRHPEETQSIAFMGLDRRTRGATYRSIWRGSSVDSPVVLTILESMHAHMRQSFAMVVASMCGAAALAVALVQTSGSGYALWVSIGIVVLLGLAIGVQRWIINRAAVVITQSRCNVPGR